MAKRNINSPAALAECEAAHRQGVTEGNGEGLAIYLSVMRDSVRKGYIDIADLEQVLLDEAGIKVV